MIKILLPIIALLLSACVNKRGVSLQYYADCKEYYDLQGFYHKDCDDELFTHKEAYDKIKDTGGKIIDTYTGKKKKEVSKPQPNVW
ncbi:hypothetical protein [Sulfurimonas sp.]|uniref:hypothetical protein n=1 Tax=Sulfurimonas sp. TaxID=2022749 RepID=UPI0039E3E7D2